MGCYNRRSGGNRIGYLVPPLARADTENGVDAVDRCGKVLWCRVAEKGARHQCHYQYQHQESGKDSITIPHRLAKILGDIGEIGENMDNTEETQYAQ